jgi:7-cyano-7-deazaguanine synthase
MAQPSEKHALGLLYSGGLDSSILLVHLLERGHAVHPIYIRSGLFWQEEELRAAAGFLRSAAAPGLKPLVSLDLPLGDLYAGHWSITGRGAPAAGTPDEAVYLPGRNPLLLIKARLWCQMHDVGGLALGCLSSNPFADATDGFFGQFQTVLDRAESGRVEFLRPLAALDKRGVMQLGRDYPLQLTFSCLSPRARPRGSGGNGAPHGDTASNGAAMHCGECNKCAERQAAFRLVGLADPTRYAARRSLV